MAGAKVVIDYKKSKEKAEEIKEEIVRLGAEAEIFRADVSIPEDAEALFRYVGERYKKLDILVNNAGVIEDSLLLTMELSHWDKVHNVNLRGAFLFTKHAAEMMMPNHSGKIINIASVCAVMGARGQANYAAAKGGLVSFTRACAVELAAKGIKVNAILPGMIVTDMSSRARKRAGDAILKRIPVGRYGEPEDVANLVLFLASDRSDYITGQTIIIDGGLSIS
jgi:3-oxoacyl-[acyl-carrier protein] reductase